MQKKENPAQRWRAGGAGNNAFAVSDVVTITNQPAQFLQVGTGVHDTAIPAALAKARHAALARELGVGVRR